ncbi:MAG: ABC transporter permease, partial [Geodermatophilaceae bacterium]|nr:ABC transporter permease [Geodermatophilaceae bacterium]
MTTTATRQAAPLPSLASVSRARVRAELLSFFREKDAVVFVLLFPVILL